MSEIILTVDGVDPVALYGANNVKLNLLRDAFPDVIITSRGQSLKISGDKKQAQKAKAKFEMMVRILREHQELPTQMVQELLSGKNPFEARIAASKPNKTILHGRSGKPIRAKTHNQLKLISAVEKMTLSLPSDRPVQERPIPPWRWP